MKNRRRNSVELQRFYNIIHKTILKYQDPTTGLLPGSPETEHAWIRDNVYSIISVWALSMAYHKSADYDEDKARAYELRQTTIKCVRGLLQCFIRQKDKIERFKNTFCPQDAVHAKFNAKTGLPVVGDFEWGHLQIDAISLYLLTVAQITAAGIHCVFSLAEVAIVQNLVHYVESAYCIPDYGIWERGDKSNTGIVELNASSIGMAAAALEAMDELNLFGPTSDESSVIHVMLDDIYKCKAVLHSMLPRESLSKETDSSLLTIIGYPAFAVEDRALAEETMKEILNKLMGNYGCIRFQRDGYKTPREDQSRLHYEPWELHLFQNIESQWPLFLCNLVINSCFSRDPDSVRRYSKQLDRLMVWKDDLPLVPELYAYPKEFSDPNCNNINRQEMVASGRIPMFWSQSLYLVGCMLTEGHIAIGELDPINRRLSSVQKPETVVQVVMLAQNKKVQDLLSQINISVKTVSEAHPVEVRPARVLSKLYRFLGRNDKLGLTGRVNAEIGMLMTSKLYKIHGKLFAFAPQRFDLSRNYMDCDSHMMVLTLEYIMKSLATQWSALGRPTLTLIVGENMTDEGRIPGCIRNALTKIRNGFIAGTRVAFGDYERFFSTSCVVEMSFLNSIHDGNFNVLQHEVSKYLNDQFIYPVLTGHKLLGTKARHTSGEHNYQRGVAMRKNSVRGYIRRSRSSIVSNLDPTTSPYSRNHSSGSEGFSRKESIQPQLDSEVTIVEFTSQEARRRLLAESKYSKNSIDELLNRLADADNLEEQADILHYLVLCNGLRHKIEVPNEEPVEIRDLLKTLYDTAVYRKQWGVVRHCAGFLERRVDDLSKAVTDMVVQQKQVTVGMPPYREVILSSGSFTSLELRRIIHEACEGDESLAMLSQELLVYLSMIIQTEPNLFHGMLRIRVGLIIQVLEQEMQRSLKGRENVDSMEELMSLSPFEMRNLLHHIMDGREFVITFENSTYNIVSEKKDVVEEKIINKLRRNASILGDHGSDKSGLEFEDDSDESDESLDAPGSWLRRRRLDGALNRVPIGFYAKAWDILQQCNTLVIHEEKRLETSLTQAMTRDELKFALVVENTFNTVPEPEFRQMLVEVLVMLSEWITHVDTGQRIDNVVDLCSILNKANELFLMDQKKYNPEGTGICCVPPQKRGCDGARGICRSFYNSAPLGDFGTFNYITRAICSVLECVPDHGYLECGPQWIPRMRNVYSRMKYDRFRFLGIL